jgi:hypothetical protein
MTHTGMNIGLHLTPFYSPADRPAWEIIDELVPVAKSAERHGFDNARR